MAALDSLTTARDNIAAQIATISVSPQPNYTIEGRTISWQSLFDSLVQRLSDIDDRIAAYDPGEVLSEGYT